MAAGSQLGEAYVPIRATLDKLDSDLAQARGKVEGALGKISSIAGGIGNTVQGIGKAALVGLGALGGLALGAAAGLSKLASQAEPLIGLQQGFAAVTGRIGTSADTMLRALQQASGGLITNRDLMASFNKAAALVSDDFANKLPDAMSLVRRASQATGQDMGFLFDSLVTGVGRVSPMILDNLGIQVQLSQVTERASEMFGKQAEELSKTEQQMALTEIVMEKLNDAYGDVPDITPTFAKARTMLANIKDEIGMKLLPVLAPLVEKFLELAEDALPVLTDILDNTVIPALMDVSEFVGELIDNLVNLIGAALDAGLASSEFQEALGLLVGEDVAAWIVNIIEQIQTFIGQVQEAVAPIVEIIAQYISWQDVLIALGIAIASVIIPIIASLIASMLPIIAVGAALIGVVALIRNAWENNWGGIQEKVAAVVNWFQTVLMPFITDILYPWLKDKLTQALQILSDFWTNTLKPAIEQVWQWMTTVLMPFLVNTVYPWLKDRLTQAIQILSDFWTNTLWPAIQNVWNWISTVLIPFFQNVVVPWLAENIPAAIQTLSDFWSGTLLPAINSVWDFINTYLVPIFVEIGEIMEIGLTLAITALQGAWKNVLLPALNEVWDFVQNYVIPALTWLKDSVVDPLGTSLKNLAQQALTWVYNKLKSLKDLLGNFKIPAWLTPGSPTPFELGIRGISDALKELQNITANMPLFNYELQPAMAWGGEDGGSMSPPSYSSSTTIYTNRDPMRVLRASRHLDKLGGLR